MSEYTYEWKKFNEEFNSKYFISNDELFNLAVEIVARDQTVSISKIQRKLSIGYNRALKILERMERKGMVGPSDGKNPREVFISYEPDNKKIIEDESRENIRILVNKIKKFTGAKKVTLEY